MLKISTTNAFLLTSLLFFGAISYAENQPWPLKRTIDLSSGFGDFRPNRFHAGVDLRTGGAVGAKVYSPVDGYIWRVRMSYRGYGKGLYVRGDDGCFYVFGHLSKFAEPLETAVRKEQFRKERYYVVVDFPRDSIRVKQGQLIAYSGKTGIGAPHLHFEKRTPDNVPIDPLNHGFVLDDATPPSFERIGFHLLDNHSLFSNGRRKMFLPVRKISDTEYVLDTVLYMNAPFGVLTHCYDQMRPGGMRQAVKKLVLMIDDLPTYGYEADSLPFETGYRVNFTYEPFEAATGEKRVRRLYVRQRSANLIDPLRDIGPMLSRGLHRGEIVATDAFGNRSTLKFSFVRGPGSYLYRMERAEDDGYYLRPPDGKILNAVEVESIGAEVMKDGRWTSLPASNVIALDSGRVKVLRDPECQDCCMRLVWKSKLGVSAVDIYFGPEEQHPSRGRWNRFRAEELGVVAYGEPDDAACGYRRHYIDRSGGQPGDRSGGPNEYGFETDLFSLREFSKHAFGSGMLERSLLNDTSTVVGFWYDQGDSILSVDSIFSISASHSDTPPMMSMAITVAEASDTSPQLLASPVYEVTPEAFVLKEPLRFALNLPTSNPLNKHAGLCWYDPNEEEWVWIDEEAEDDNLAAGPSLGGGLFAAIIDTTAPKLTDLNLKRGHRYWNKKLRVRFNLEDNLSGFEDDRSLDVRIDGNWLLPEFDIEDGEVVATLKEPLALGHHTLTVAATDRAGNKTEREVEFEVISRSK